MPDTVTSTLTDKDILQLAQQYVLQLFNQKQDGRLVYHNYQQTTEMLRYVENIAESEAIPASILEVASLAALFRNVGHLFNYRQPLPRSRELAKNFLRSQNYSNERLERVLNCLQYLPPLTNSSLEQQIAQDAYHATHTGVDFFEKNPLLRLEQELILNQNYSKHDWALFQMQQLLATRFSTAYAKKHFEPLLAQHILKQKNILEKLQLTEAVDSEESGNIRLYQDIEKKIPNRAAQTFFRSNYRNHINLSAIADNKANIMISVNSILISVLITVLSYRNIAETNPGVLLPIVIFLVTGLASLIFAVLSSRPKVTSINEDKREMSEIQRNVIFFGNFVNLSMEQYETAMDAVLRDGELMYGNMTRDLYFLGKVLDKKYRYLSFSYNIFMVGFVASVAAYIFILFT
ncbi:MAG: Pycsar system effector family protein [Saprospiraceae bacterium]